MTSESAGRAPTTKRATESENARRPPAVSPVMANLQDQSDASSARADSWTRRGALLVGATHAFARATQVRATRAGVTRSVALLSAAVARPRSPGTGLTVPAGYGARASARARRILRVERSALGIGGRILSARGRLFDVRRRSLVPRVDRRRTGTAACDERAYSEETQQRTRLNHLNLRVA